MDLSYYLKAARELLGVKDEHRKHRILETSDDESMHNVGVPRKKVNILSESDDESTIEVAGPSTIPLPHVSIASPVIPAKLLQDLLEKCNVIDAKKKSLVILICKYWSLKREVRKGAALLKRLHLEPWTAEAAASRELEEKSAKQHDMLIVVRKDLERLRLLVEHVQRREKLNLRLAITNWEIAELAICPLASKYRAFVEKCKRFDRSALFHLPVDLALVPDYSQFVKNPIDFLKIGEKIDSYQYADVQEFIADIRLISTNCRKYNSADSIYARQADKLESYADSLIPGLLNFASSPDLSNFRSIAAAAKISKASDKQCL